MGRKIHVGITATIDLADIPTSDLMGEVERRGKGRQFRAYDTRDLLEELAGRVNLGFEHINILIMALSDLGCPSEITQPIEKWASEPVATPLKLKEWEQFCTAGKGER